MDQTIELKQFPQQSILDFLKQKKQITEQPIKLYNKEQYYFSIKQYNQLLTYLQSMKQITAIKPQYNTENILAVTTKTQENIAFKAVPKWNFNFPVMYNFYEDFRQYKYLALADLNYRRSEYFKQAFYQVIKQGNQPFEVFMKKEYPKYKWNLKLYEKEFSEKGFWVKFEKLVKSKYAEFFSDSKKIKENILIKRKSTLSKFDVIKAMMKLKNKLIDYNVLRLI